MKKALFYTFIIMIWGCKHQDNYINPPVYNIKIGESCKIYFGTNSCCNYSVEVQNSQNIKITDTLLVEEAEKDCAGCNTEYAYVFKGLKEGSDTVKLYSVDMGSFMNLEDSTWNLKTSLINKGYSLDGSYIIHISK